MKPQVASYSDTPILSLKPFRLLPPHPACAKVGKVLSRSREDGAARPGAGGSPGRGRACGVPGVSSSRRCFSFCFEKCPEIG